MLDKIVIRFEVNIYIYIYKAFTNNKAIFKTELKKIDNNN